MTKLEGGTLCLAHASLVTGDLEICERIEGGLPPFMDGDELECGPFGQVYYEEKAQWQDSSVR
jgi:hypothetical protein